MSDAATSPRQRLDVWLWRARLFKTRSEAARCIAAGGVRLARDGQVAAAKKPAALVGPGDGVTVAVNGRVRCLVIVALGGRRGPPAEARTLYRSLEGENPDVDALDAGPPGASSSPDL